MPTRFSCTALVLVIACLTVGAVRADDADDIEALYRAGQVEQALQRADAVIAEQPRAARVRFLKGVMLGETGRDAQAIEVYLALTQDFPELADPYNNLAVLYAATGQLPQALAALQSALRNDPQHLRARENLGDVYLALAVQAWDTAAELGKGEDTGLVRKLQQARALVPKPMQQGEPRPRR